jgi:hypothetical protein
MIFQSHLWRNRALSTSPPPRRIYSGFLQELLKRIPREVDPGRHAQTSTVGKQAHVPPVIKDKRNESPMNNRLSSLVKCVGKLREAGLRACHYVEEFHLW